MKQIKFTLHAGTEWLIWLITLIRDRQKEKKRYIPPIHRTGSLIDEVDDSDDPFAW